MVDMTLRNVFTDPTILEKKFIKKEKFSFFFLLDELFFSWSIETNKIQNNYNKIQPEIALLVNRRLEQGHEVEKADKYFSCEHFYE